VSNYAERLIALAQQLDELSDDMPELGSISEELGRIADAWPENRLNEDPRWLQHLRGFVEQAAMEIVAERHGTVNTATNGMSRISVPSFVYASATPDPQALLKGISAI
jgi:hypothetical protein